MTAVWVDIVDADGESVGRLNLAMDSKSEMMASRVAAGVASVRDIGGFLANAKLSNTTIIPGKYGKDRDSRVLVVLPSEERQTKREKTRSDDIEVIDASDWFGEQNALEEIESGEKTVRILRMNDFPPVDQVASDKNVIYERECYVTIFDQLVEMIQTPRGSDPYYESIVIGGNPGVGKSRFYLFCAFRLALDDSVRKLLPSSFELVLNFKDVYHVFDPATRTFTSVVHTADLRNLRRGLDVVRLVEADSNRLTGWRGITVLFTSPGLTKIHSFLKNRGMTFIMPAWSLEELQTYCAVVEPQPPMYGATLVERFNICGGIPRSIFNTNPTVFEGLLAEALTKFQSVSLIDLATRGASSTEVKYSHRILEMVPTSTDFRVMYRLEFLSNHIAARVATQLMPDSERQLSAFFSNDSSPASSLVGVIYKMLCHRKIEKCKGALTLRFRALTSGGDFTLAIPEDLRVVEFDTLDDIREVPVGTTYYKSKEKHYAAVDTLILVGGAIPTCYGLQMTMNRDHGIMSSGLTEFEDFLNRLKVTNSLFNFVMPQTLAADYPAQTLRTVKNDLDTRTPSNVAQYVAGLDVFAFTGDKSWYSSRGNGLGRGGERE